MKWKREAADELLEAGRGGKNWPVAVQSLVCKIPVFVAMSWLHLLAAVCFQLPGIEIVCANWQLDIHKK